MIDSTSHHSTRSGSHRPQSSTSNTAQDSSPKICQEEEVVNLLDLAAAAVACTVTASRKILTLSSMEQNAKNTRLKSDGSFVTDADFAAQGVIVHAIQSVSKHVRVVGEESVEEMAAHHHPHPHHAKDNNEEDGGECGEYDTFDDEILQRTRAELRLRLVDKGARTELPLGSDHSSAGPIHIHPLHSNPFDPEDCIVEASRVSVIVDPLDGTKSYAHGDYDSVSILIGIIVDNAPCFGVIGKPFGYTGLPPIRSTGCVTIYGGSLLQGVYIAGSGPVTPTPIDTKGAVENRPRAVISGSRSKGVVRDFCCYLGEKGLVYPEPLLISGAGEKSLRLILQKNNEALWFYPKSGTARWDVAAPDALLRSLGGRLTDKFGNEFDYSTSRENSENTDGLVACIDAQLHAECVRLFKEGDWRDRT